MVTHLCFPVRRLVFTRVGLGSQTRAQTNLMPGSRFPKDSTQGCPPARRAPHTLAPPVPGAGAVTWLD